MEDLCNLDQFEVDNIKMTAPFEDLLKYKAH